MRVLPWVFVFLLMDVPAHSDEQRIWSWKDKAGVIHYTDDPEQLPEPQRSEALRELEKNPPPAKAPEPEANSPPAAPEKMDFDSPTPVSTGGAAVGSQQRRELKERLEKAYQNYLKTKENCRQAEEELSIAKRDGLAIYGNPASGGRVSEAESKLKRCREDLSRSKADFLKELAAARQAGISVSGYNP